MRTFLALTAVIALAACGGGSGGGNTTPPASAPVPTPTASGPGTASKYAAPSFRITVPAASGSSTRRKPQFISSATQSITIVLTADSAGVDSATLAGNPATTNISAASCAGGCTVNGPTSPPGNDTYTLTTYDQANGAGNALDSATGTFTIVSGITNTETITLNGIPAHITFAALPTYNAGTPGNTPVGASGVAVAVTNADGEAITGNYANPVTIADPDTNGDGTSLQSSTPCPAPPVGNPPVAPTQLNLTSSTSSIVFCYGGIAEPAVTLLATASGVLPAPSNFTPQLSAPAYVAGSGTPVGVVVGANPPDIELYATSGTGSSGSVNYSEVGWTNAPYNQSLGAYANLPCTSGTSFSNYATISTSPAAGATTITATAIGSPTAGACPLTLWDGLPNGITSTTFDTSYTTSGFSVNGRRRH